MEATALPTEPKPLPIYGLFTYIPFFKLIVQGGGVWYLLGIVWIRTKTNAGSQMGQAKNIFLSGRQKTFPVLRNSTQSQWSSIVTIFIAAAVVVVPNAAF